MFLMWFDDTPKRTQEDKIRAALAAHLQKFNQPATVVLVNPAEVVEVSGVVVRGVGTVAKNTVWAGRE